MRGRQRIEVHLDTLSNRQGPWTLEVHCGSHTFTRKYRKDSRKAARQYVNIIGLMCNMEVPITKVRLLGRRSCIMEYER